MFNTKLRELRNYKGITQAELAKHLDVTQQAVGRWEKAITSPDYETLKKIADYFHVSTDYLLGRSNNPHGDPFAGQREGDFITFADETAHAAAGSTGTGAEIRASIGTAIAKSGHNTIGMEPLTPEELSLLEAYRKASDRDKGIVDAVLRSMVRTEEEKQA